VKRFGKHLTVDGYGANKSLLGNMQRIYEFLDHLPEVIGMRKISPPWVINYTCEKLEDAGLSGFVIIAESHISIHTFPEKNFASIDVFSCRDFPVEIAKSYIQEMFGFDSLETTVIDRGRKFEKVKSVVP